MMAVCKCQNDCELVRVIVLLQGTRVAFNNMISRQAACIFFLYSLQ